MHAAGPHASRRSRGHLLPHQVGSKTAPQESGTGKIVAVQAVKPVRHSSWATAGMPNRPPSQSGAVRGQRSARRGRWNRTGAERPGELAEPSRMRSASRRPRRSSRPGSARLRRAVGGRPDPAGCPAGHLLGERHPAEQVGDALRAGREGSRQGRGGLGAGHHRGRHEHVLVGAAVDSGRSAQCSRRGSSATAALRSGRPASGPRPGPSRRAAAAPW